MVSGAPRFGTSGLAPGTVLDGKYEIVGLLGAGGMGEVYKVRHLHLHTFRCVKVMKGGLLADETFRSRFLREAQLATQIHHPNIAIVHDFSVLDSLSYMVTEFIDGTTVRQWSAANGRFPVELAVDVAVQTLAGLDYIHRRGLLHRDISADNVMLMYDSDDRLMVKIIDLGIAKDVTSNTDTTQQGLLIGNPKYMSPEQLGELQEGEQLDGRADLYCFGIVLYEMLAGVPPFVAKTPNGYIVKHLTQPPPPFRESNAAIEIPPGLEAVIFKTLEKDRRRRHANAPELAQALMQFTSRRTAPFTRDEIMRVRASEEATMIAPIPTDIVRPGTSSQSAATSALSVDEAFQAAWEDGTPAIWRQFLAAHGDSGHADRARDLLAEAVAFADAGESLTSIREFLKRFPDGRHRLDAEIRLVRMKESLADVSWKDAVAADSYAAYREFLANFPLSSHAAQANEALAERLAFDTAAALDTEDSWERYLARWSVDRHAAAARARLEAARSREETAWAAALAAKTADAWQAYLDEFPDGKRSGRAEAHRREAADFDVARANGRHAMDEFVRVHPDGLLRREAKKLLHDLADNDDFEQALRFDTIAAWSLYLTTHPAGAHRETANERLAELEDAEYRAVLASKDVRRAQQFFASFPASPRVPEMKRLAAKWEDTGAAHQAMTALARGDGEAAARLLGKVVDGERRREIEKSLDAWRDQRSWEEASGASTMAALQAYLQARPDGRWAADARKRVARLESTARENEPADFEKAFESGTSASWDAYLSLHAGSARAAEARQCRQEAHEFEIATQLDKPALWRAFVKAWPDGRHRLDAELRLDRKG